MAVTGKVFLLSQCPPPGASQTTCTLTGYLADPGRDDLLYGQRGEAIPLSEGGRLVSCIEGTSPGVSCPGWQNGVAYRLVAIVERRPVGTEVELEVSSKQPA